MKKWSVGGNITMYDEDQKGGVRFWTREDAILAAAAPEMLEALEIIAKTARNAHLSHLHAEDRLGFLKSIAELADAALAKAKGEEND